MNQPLHPLFVHLPLALAVLQPLLAAGLAFALWRSWLPLRTWWLVVAGQVLLTGSGLLALRTGEADEEAVERVVAEASIERHEDAAKGFVAASGVALAIALLPLLLRQRPRLVHAAAVATPIAGLGVLGLAWRTGAAGGDLVYRDGAAAAFATGGDANARPAPVTPRREHDEH